MSRPPDDRPTAVIPQQTVEQPAVSTAPATRRAQTWHRIPARIGRARTSTVVIGCLFVLLFALNSTLPRDQGGSTPVVLPSGRTVDVPNSALPEEVPPTTPAPATAPATTQPPAPTRTATPTTSAPGSTAPTTDGGDREEGSTTPDPTEEETTREAPSTSSAPASRAPSTSARPTSSAPTS